MSSVFQTIVAGVSVFVLGQFIVKLVLEPLVRYKEALGDVSAVFLQFQAKIINANGGNEVAEHIKYTASKLISLKQAVPFYGALSAISRLPSDNSLIEGCRSMNFVASSQITKDPSNIEAEMSNIERALGVRVRYG